jgi:photosystem II stability/assembly factor-like uncharacterized protein
MRKILFVMFAIILTMNCGLKAQSGWTLQTNPLGTGDQAMLGKVHFVSQTEGWIATSKGGLLHTTDGGVNWDIINPFPTDTVECLSDPSIGMCWVGELNGWQINSIGSIDEPRGAVLYRTTNGGGNWEKIGITTEDGVAGIQVQFIDANNGWVLLYNFSNGNASLLKTTNGGNDWSNLSPRGIFQFVDLINGWSFFGSGTGFEPPYQIYKTTDGGSNWLIQSSDSTEGMYNALHFNDLNNGWVVGELGKVLHTTDGGVNWNYVLNTGINSDQSCKTVFFLNPTTGWIPSKTNNNEPFIKYTTDGGASWTTQQTPLANPGGYNSIFSICFYDMNNGWLTADHGRIARFTGTTDVKTIEITVNDFFVAQNFPNPFNPSTLISWQSPVSSHQTIKVFDLLGNEISTLVDEYKLAGKHEVEFNASQLSNGVYFYRLEAGDYIQTRKMLLLK